MFTVVLLLSVLHYTVFITSVYADEDVKRCWCLRIHEYVSTEGSVYEQRVKNTASVLMEKKQVKLINNKDLNQTLLCDSSAYTECLARCTSGNIWRSVYQAIIISSVFILSVLSEKLAGSKTHPFELFKRRNRFIEEIEEIKRWGDSMKPNIIVEQDWKIDWSSDIWLGNNNDVETSSTVLIHYKKTQVKSLEDQNFNKR